MHFAAPELFALLALAPLFALALHLEWRSRGAALRLPTLQPLLVQPAAPTLRRRLLPWLPGLRVAALVLIVVALARPQTGDAAALVPAEGIDVVLTIDTSGSMVHTPLGDESRLEAARRVARDFVARRGNDRLGLVVFQSESLVLSPLTVDLDAIDRLIADAVRTGLLRDGTAVGLALAESVDLLRESTAPSRAVVLLTDGEDNVRTVRPVQAAAVAKALGVRVYTIGVTDPEGEQGRIDELALQFIAVETGGAYFHATQPDELESAYEQIDALERAQVGDDTFTRYRELAPWFLIPALALVALELAAHASWWRRAP